MKTPDQEASVLVGFTEDDLLLLEMKIAERADQISRGDGASRRKDMDLWMQAEHEMFEQAFDYSRGADSGMPGAALPFNFDRI